MLSAWSAENINQVAPGQRGGKTRKALGDTGLGSENAPPSSRKGGPLSDAKGTKQRRPLGYRSENSQQTVGKVERVTDSKPKHRKALGDISNSRKGSLGGSGSLNGAKLGGKQVPSGLNFFIHSDSQRKDASSASAGKASMPQSVAKPRIVIARDIEKAVATPESHVDDVEMVMGRTWEEEDALVQKKAEQRAAKALNPFRPASKRTPRARNVTSFPVPAPSSSPRVGEAASAPREEGQSPVDGIADSDHRLECAIDRMVLRDFEDTLSLIHI